MPSTFTLAGPKGLGKPKRKSKHNLALGECVCILNPRTKRRVSLCNTGKGRSGHQFKKGGC